MNPEILQKKVAEWEAIGATTLDTETRNLEKHLLSKDFPMQPSGYLEFRSFHHWGEHIVHDFREREGAIIDNPQKRFEAFIEKDNPLKKVSLFFRSTSFGYELCITNTETRDTIVINCLCATFYSDETGRKPSDFFPDLEPIERFKAVKAILSDIQYNFETDESRESVRRTNEKIAQDLARYRCQRIYT